MANVETEAKQNLTRENLGTVPMDIPYLSIIKMHRRIVGAKELSLVPFCMVRKIYVIRTVDGYIFECMGCKQGCIEHQPYIMAHCYVNDSSANGFPDEHGDFNMQFRLLTKRDAICLLTERDAIIKLEKDVPYDFIMKIETSIIKT